MSICLHVSGRMACCPTTCVSWPTSLMTTPSGSCWMVTWMPTGESLDTMPSLLLRPALAASSNTCANNSCCYLCTAEAFFSCWRSGCYRPAYPWAALYNTWLLTKLTLKGAVFSFLFRPVWRQHQGRMNWTGIAGWHLPSIYIHKNVLCAGLRA